MRSFIANALFFDFVANNRSGPLLSTLFLRNKLNYIFTVPSVFNITTNVLNTTCRILRKLRDRYGRDRMVVGFITSYAISIYHH